MDMTSVHCQLGGKKHHTALHHCVYAPALSAEPYYLSLSFRERQNRRIGAKINNIGTWMQAEASCMFFPPKTQNDPGSKAAKICVGARKAGGGEDACSPKAEP